MGLLSFSRLRCKSETEKPRLPCVLQRSASSGLWTRVVGLVERSSTGSAPLTEIPSCPAPLQSYKQKPWGGMSGEDGVRREKRRVWS